MSQTNPQHIARAFNRAAKTYDEHAILQRKVVDALYQKISQHITPSSLILDAGCGTGYFQEVLRKHGHKNTLWQVDFSPAMCAIAENYAALPEFATTHTLCTDIRHLEFEPETFDLIFSSLTLQWLTPDELENTLAQLYLLLKPGGVLAISSLCHGTLTELEAYDPSLIQHFPKKSLWEEMANNFSAKLSSDNYKLWYPDAVSLLKSMKSIGANHLETHFLRNKTYFHKLNQHYQQQHYVAGKGVPASWEVVSLIGEKQ